MFGFMKSRPAAVSISQISGVDAVSGTKSGKLTLIDVREPGEVSKSGKARGALHIPLMTLNSKADPGNPDFHPDLDMDKPVVLYCASGARSQMAAKTLLKLGYQSVYNLGPLSNWSAAGGRIAR